MICRYTACRQSVFCTGLSQVDLLGAELSLKAGNAMWDYHQETGSDSPFSYDITYQGPLAGFTIHW